jgi:hypothetical protein
MIFAGKDMTRVDRWYADFSASQNLSNHFFKRKIENLAHKFYFMFIRVWIYDFLEIRLFLNI